MKPLLRVGQTWIHNDTIHLIVEIIGVRSPETDYDESVTLQVKEYDIPGYVNYVYDLTEEDVYKSFTLISDVTLEEPSWEVT